MDEYFGLMNSNPIGISGSNLGTVGTRQNLSTTYSTQTPGSSAYVNGVAPTGTNVTNPTGTVLANPYLEYNNAEGLGGLTNGTWNNLGQAAGLAGTAYNLYDNILGNKADMYKTQMAAMKQNMANVAEDRANHKAFQGNFGSGINSAMGSGLAASSAMKK